MTEHKKEPLPDWFNLEKYEKCSDFNVYDWWVEINRRVLAYQHWSIDTGDINADEARRTRITKTIRGFTDIPLLINKEPTPELEQVIKGMEMPRCLSNLSKYRPECNTTSVNAFNWFDANNVVDIWERHQLGRDSVNYFFYKLNNVTHKESTYCEKVNSPLDVTIHSEFPEEIKALITIDLSMGNKQIIRDMEKFLPIYRKMLKKNITREKKFSDNEIRKFKDYKVLPILDLELWAMVNYIDLAKKYGEKHIAAHLGETENRYFQTVKPVALEFLEIPEKIEILRHQAFSFHNG